MPLGYSDAFRIQAERRAELRRMRIIATLLLVLMAVIFLAMRRAPPNWIWAPYLGAFAEAGMVGACADWFAVVALFRRPLGLPIRHTAVVPENKRRIGAAMGRFITNNFSPRASPSRACRRSTLSVLLRDGWRTRATRRRSPPPPANTIPYTLGLAPKEAVDEWVAFAAPARDRGGPRGALRLARACYPVRAGDGKILLDQGLDFVETTLARHKATIVKRV